MDSNKNIISADQICWFVLGLIILASAVLRYSLIDIPFERDEGEYAYAGQLILKGIPPYREVFNMKLPGIYYAYSLILYVFGETHQGVHTGLIFINSITIVLVFILAKQMMNRWGAFFSAACFTFMSLLESVQGLSANAEHFVVFFTVMGLLVLIRALSEESLPKIFCSGLLLGFAFIMKQHGAAFCILGFVYISYVFLRQNPFCFSKLLLNQALFCIGFLAVYFFICLIMLKYGVFRNFWFWTVDYDSAYVSQLSWMYAIANLYENADRIVRSAILIWIVIALGFVVLLSRKFNEIIKSFLFLFAIFSFLSLCPGGFFRPHYFIMFLPIASLLGGVAVNYFTTSLRDFYSPGKTNATAMVVLFILFTSSVFTQRDPLFFMNPLQISRSTYGLNPFIESIQLSEFIKKNTNKYDEITILGSEPQVFFYSGRQSASGHIYMYPLMEKHEFASQMQKKFIDDIETKKPKYYVFVNIPTSWLATEDSHMDILYWFRSYSEKYTKLIGIIDVFNDKSLYYWGEEAHWPPASPYYVAVFERQPEMK